MLARQLAQQNIAQRFDSIPEQLEAKTKLAFMDVLSCQFEAVELAHCQQVVKAMGGTSPLLAQQNAFYYAVLAHALVREDMHAPSVSHLGSVIFPTLMAVIEAVTNKSKSRSALTGKGFINAAFNAYEVGGGLGSFLMQKCPNISKCYRPSGITGPIAGAIAAGNMLALNEDQQVSALAFAANTVSGLNEWACSGTDDMYLHLGFAARNAVTSVELAQAGLFGTESIFEGPSGLFAALGCNIQNDSPVFFNVNQLILEQVYFKPAPACNYAQTPCQIALQLASNNEFSSQDIGKVKIQCSDVAVSYPGCNSKGPFERQLQAKMSIGYGVASTLVTRELAERNYHLLDNDEIKRLISVTTLVENKTYSLSYPGKQGAEVILYMRDGRELCGRLDDLQPASAGYVRKRFIQAAQRRYDDKKLNELIATIDRLDEVENLQGLMHLIRQGLA